ncbi:MAG TPA: hypothetical protein VGB51_03810 [Actinomycetota bacterium]
MGYRRRSGAVRATLWLAIVCVALLSSCAAGPNPAVGATEDPAGFWMGLWHGIILIVTFFISLFTDDVSVYEVTNTGNWYDFGFVLGASMALGGTGRGAAGRKRR